MAYYDPILQNFVNFCLGNSIGLSCVHMMRGNTRYPGSEVGDSPIGLNIVIIEYVSIIVYYRNSVSV